MTDIAESGDVYFLYRPRVGEEATEGLDEIQRLFMVLRPRDTRRFRRIVIGRKQLPDPERSERFWGFVDTVTTRGAELGERASGETRETRTRGERVQPEDRPVGEGVYAITRHHDHTHFSYRLELPRQRGEPHRELNVEPEASYVVSVKDPEQPAPPGAGLSSGQKARLPQELHQRFAGRRFVPLDPPDFLDHEGIELVLIAASAEVSDELGAALPGEQENAETADIFDQLRIDRDRHPTEPLLDGEWQ